MRLIIGILVFVPCAIPLCIFAVENRQSLALQFTPLAAKFELPVALWLLIFLGVGTVVGLVIGFLSTITWRRRARKAERLNRVFEGKPEKQVEIIPEISPRESLPSSVLPREGAQTHSALIDDR